MEIVSMESVLHSQNTHTVAILYVKVNGSSFLGNLWTFRFCAHYESRVCHISYSPLLHERSVWTWHVVGLICNWNGMEDWIGQGLDKKTYSTHFDTQIVFQAGIILAVLLTVKCSYMVVLSYSDNITNCDNTALVRGTLNLITWPWSHDFGHMTLDTDLTSVLVLVWVIQISDKIAQLRTRNEINDFSCVYFSRFNTQIYAEWWELLEIRILLNCMIRQML